MKQIARQIFLIFFSFCLINFSFSQTGDEAQIEELENNASAGANEIVDSLQRNFTILVAQQPWNLDVHTATYSSEAQILDSLYEGLFSYDPKTLEPVPAIAESFKISRDKKRWACTRCEVAFFRV